MKPSTVAAVILISAIATVTLGCDRINPEIITAKKSLESHLVDPGSVEYKDVRRYADGTVCGQYNAKNRMGGYTGFEKFIFWKDGLIAHSHVDDNFHSLCSDEKNKVEVNAETIHVDFTPSKSAGKKSQSALVHLYVDANSRMLTLYKRDAVEAKIKQVFEGREPKELEGDRLNNALLNALVSDKELSSIHRVTYSIW